MVTTQAAFTLSITEEERAELLQLLEQALSNTHMERRRTEAPDYHQQVVHEEELLRILVDKVRRLKQ